MPGIIHNYLLSVCAYISHCESIWFLTNITCALVHSYVVVCLGHLLLVIWPHTRQLKHHILNQCSPSHPSLMLSADNDVQCKRQPSHASQWPWEGCRNSLRISTASNLQCVQYTLLGNMYIIALYVLIAGYSSRMGCTYLFVERHMDCISFVLIVCTVFTAHLHIPVHHTNVVCVCVWTHACILKWLKIHLAAWGQGMYSCKFSQPPPS